MKRMVVRGCGRPSAILCISITKVLKILKSFKYKIKPKKNHYDVLKIDEFWTYVGKKSNKMWLIYAYHRASGEIVAYVWGKRDLKTAQKLKKKLKRLGITYDRIATDDWQSFVSTFTETEHDIGKKHTVGIEGRADCGIGIGVFSGRHAVFQKNASSIGRYLMRHSFTSMKVGCLSILCGSPPPSWVFISETISIVLGRTIC
jgi:IS1 family transposase